MPKKILVLTELFLPTKGGTAIWAAEVYRRIGGAEIHIVTAAVPGSDAVDAHHPNTIHRISMKRQAWLRPESLALYFNLLTKALRVSKAGEFETVHAFRALPEGLVGWLVARLANIPLVVFAHGEELTTWGHGAKFHVMKFVLKSAERVVANSEHTKSTLMNLGVAQGRIRVVYPGVDTERFRSGLPTTGLREMHGLRANVPIVLSIGRLSRRKGFDNTIRAVDQLIRSGLELNYVIGGIGEDAGYLQGIIDALDLNACIKLIGEVAEEDLPRWLNACDVFVMPNREINGDNEGFGMVFIEAAACGKPSVAGKDGGTGAAVLDGITGLRVDGANVGEIANGLSSLILNQGRAKEMGAAGFRRATQLFGWESVAARLIAESSVEAI